MIRKSMLKKSNSMASSSAKDEDIEMNCCLKPNNMDYVLFSFNGGTILVPHPTS
jgi:hypothetical protein